MAHTEVSSRDNYITLSREGFASLTEKRSVFHAFAAPAVNEAQINDHITAIKRKYPDAVHHVYAWIIGGDTLRNKYSDDGEPSGTAGLPVLDALRKRNIEDAVVIVTRYFGGTLLGTGGLVRAYSNACVFAIDKAVPVTMIRSMVYEVITDYHDFEIIRQAVKEMQVELSDAVYGSSVSFCLSVPYNLTEKVISSINDATCGRALLNFRETGYVRSPVS